MWTKEESKKRRLETCKFYSGTVNKTCEAGVVYDEVKTGENYPRSYPCYSNLDTCAKKQCPTPEDVAAEEEATDRLIKQVLWARKAIVQFTDGKRGQQGVINCPVCKDGQLSFSVSSYNGHITAKCSVPDCVSWIE